MSDDKISKELFELHMKNANASFNRIEANVVKLFERQDDMNVTLARNTQTVQEHHARSTRLEGVVEELVKQLSQVSISMEKINTRMDNQANEVGELKESVDDLDKDIKPLKIHVSKLNKFMQGIKDFPKSAKIVLIAVGIILLLTGIVNGTIEAGNLVKILLK